MQESKTQDEKKARTKTHYKNEEEQVQGQDK